MNSNKYVLGKLFTATDTSNSGILADASHDYANGKISFTTLAQVYSDCSNGERLTALAKISDHTNRQKKICMAMPSNSTTLHNFKATQNAKKILEAICEKGNAPENAYDLCRVIVADTNTRV